MRKLITGLIITISYSFNVWAWNAEVNHKDISQKAAERSNLSLTGGDYLKNLGFDKNLDEKFALNGGTPQTVIKWIGEVGAVDEDSGNIINGRYYNHFHDPTRAWGEAGLQSFWPWVLNGESAVLWAVQDNTNEWRWQGIRDYYENALTSQTKTDRDAYFAQTFSGIGHIIHLLEDMSQPAHVRNDPHPFDDKGYLPGFEYWTKMPENRAYISSLMSAPVFPSINLNTSNGGYVPITRFFDSDSTAQTLSSSLTLGLAEYTNANFFSENTIFIYPYPSWSNLVEYAEILDINTMERRSYFRKLGEGVVIEDKTGYGEPVEHFATTKLFYKYLPTSSKHLGLKLDDNVYKDYAQKLIPRAVGYSAGLINYFFRGKMNMIPNTDGTGGFVITNDSDEPMSGTFSLYYDDEEDIRHPVDGTSWNLTINGKTGTEPGKSIPVTFSEPIDPAPKEKNKYMLVFQGIFGSEQGAVVGKVVDVSVEKELILYAIGSEYKTYNLETGEIRPYEGILKGATGKVIWKDDGTAAIANYMNSWSYVDVANNANETIMSYVNPANGGWKGDMPVLMGINGDINYWEGSGYRKTYDLPSEIMPLNSMAVSENGTKISYNVKTRDEEDRSYHIIDFDTTSRTFSDTRVGENTNVVNDGIWICQEWLTSTGTEAITNYPVVLSYSGNSREDLYSNSTTTWWSVPGDWYHSYYKSSSGYSTTTRLYDYLGSITASSSSFRACEPAAWNSFTTYNDYHPLDFAISAGGDKIIPFIKEETSDDFDFFRYPDHLYTMKITPCLYFNGNICSNDIIELNDTRGNTFFDSILNLNPKRDKAIVLVNAKVQTNSPHQIHTKKMIFYISGGELRDITTGNPELKDASFVSFLVEKSNNPAR